MSTGDKPYLWDGMFFVKQKTIPVKTINVRLLGVTLFAALGKLDLFILIFLSLPQSDFWFCLALCCYCLSWRGLVMSCHYSSLSSTTQGRDLSTYYIPYSYCQLQTLAHQERCYLSYRSVCKPPQHTRYPFLVQSWDIHFGLSLTIHHSQKTDLLSHDLCSNLQH